MPIGGGIVDAHQLSIGEMDGAGALDVKKKAIHPIAKPNQLELSPAELIFEIDLAPCKVGHHFTIFQTGAEAFTRPVRSKPGEIDFDQIGGTGIEWVGKFRRWLQTTGEIRFVVAGEQNIALTLAA